jgi:hypothetical protein
MRRQLHPTSVQNPEVKSDLNYDPQLGQNTKPHKKKKKKKKKKSHLNYSAFNVKPGRVQTELDTKLGSKQNNLRGIR